MSSFWEATSYDMTTLEALAFEHRYAIAAAVFVVILFSANSCCGNRKQPAPLVAAPVRAPSARALSRRSSYESPRVEALRAQLADQEARLLAALNEAHRKLEEARKLQESADERARRETENAVRSTRLQMQIQVAEVRPRSCSSFRTPALRVTSPPTHTSGGDQSREAGGREGARGAGPLHGR